MAKFNVEKLVAKSHGEPVNGVSGKPYSGENYDALLTVIEENEYESSVFVTFKQAEQIGRRVRKGERSCATVVRWVKRKEDEGKKLKKGEKPKLVPKYYAVFNIEQTEEVERTEPIHVVLNSERV
jgi:antirestriction protein ArdC